MMCNQKMIIFKMNGPSSSADTHQSSVGRTSHVTDLSVSHVQVNVQPAVLTSQLPAASEVSLSTRRHDLSTASTAPPAVAMGTSGTLTLKDLEDSSPDVDSNPGSLCVSVLHPHPTSSDTSIVYEDSDRAYSASGFGVTSAASLPTAAASAVASAVASACGSAAARSEAVLASSQWFAHNTSLALSTLSPSVLFNMPSHPTAVTPPRGTHVASTAAGATPVASGLAPGDSDVPHAEADGSVSMSFEDATTFAHAAAKLVSEFQQEHPSAWHPHISLVSSARPVAPPSASEPKNVSGLASLHVGCWW